MNEPILRVAPSRGTKNHGADCASSGSSTYPHSPALKLVFDKERVFVRGVHHGKSQCRVREFPISPGNLFIFAAVHAGIFTPECFADEHHVL